ncbi:hypothetical protein [Burkholderia ubonensis]|uniref:hypothetical protein n=1 Tax=Burkholderia ubonensis TaxID=101571 RepID=UPI0012F8C4EF|nr:hypothetical protein [Burkholderia ubonensis]
MEKPHGGRESAMVIRIAALTLLLLQNHGAVAGTMSRDKAERAVVRESIEITTNGAWSADISEDERADACSAVILRQADVGAFFKRASRVTERAYSHDLDSANCYAEGKSSSGEWWRGEMEDRSGKARLRFDARRSNDLSVLSEVPN